MDQNHVISKFNVLTTFFYALYLFGDRRARVMFPCKKEWEKLIGRDNGGLSPRAMDSLHLSHMIGCTVLNKKYV